MANVLSAFGFKHIGFLSGAGPDYQLATRAIQSTNATKIFFGDPVIKQLSSAYIHQAATATNTTVLEGIFQGCTYVPAGGVQTWSPYWPGAAAVDATAYIMNAPNALFLAAALNTAISSANIGEGIGCSTSEPDRLSAVVSLAQRLIRARSPLNNNAPFQIVSLYHGRRQRLRSDHALQLGCRDLQQPAVQEPTRRWPDPWRIGFFVAFYICPNRSLPFARRISQHSVGTVCRASLMSEAPTT